MEGVVSTTLEVDGSVSILIYVLFGGYHETLGEFSLAGRREELIIFRSAKGYFKGAEIVVLKNMGSPKVIVAN